MDLLVYLILLAVGGLILGALARLALPGRDPMGLFATMMVGIAGSLIAGVVWWLIVGEGVPGLLISLAGAVLIVYFIRKSRGGGLMDPGEPGRR